MPHVIQRRDHPSTRVRFRSERCPLSIGTLSAFNRNRCPLSIGTGVRFQSEYALALGFALNGIEVEPAEVEEHIGFEALPVAVTA